MQFAGRHARRPPGSCPRGRLNPVTPHMHLAAWKGGGLLAGFRHGRWLLRSRPEQSPQAVDPRKDRERRNVSRDTRGPSATPSLLPCVRGRRSEQVRRHLDLFRPPCGQTCFDPPRRHPDGVAAAALDIPGLLRGRARPRRCPPASAAPPNAASSFAKQKFGARSADTALPTETRPWALSLVSVSETPSLRTLPAALPGRHVIGCHVIGCHVIGRHVIGRPAVSHSVTR